MTLKSLFVYPTFQCNLNCAHCWIRAGKKTYSELTSEEIQSAVHDALDLGLKSVKITGGEPFLREDITIGLLKYLDEQHISAAVETNGTVLTPTSKKALLDYCPEVMISMDGATPQGFASLRGNPHLFDTVLENVRFLLDAGIELVCSMSIHKGNLGELDDFVDLVQQMDGYIRLLVYTELGRAQNLERKFTMKEITDISKRISDILKKNAKVSSNIPPALLDGDAPFEVCAAGRESAVLLPNGDISFCAYTLSAHKPPAGNIGEHSLKEIWESAPMFQLLQGIESRLEKVCSACIFRNYCQGSCRAWAYDTYESLTAPYPLCQKVYEEGLFPEEFLIKEVTA